jgi:hypothetical protein
MMQYEKRKNDQEKSSPYSGVERHLLNTFFSGVYISAKDFVLVGRALGFEGLSLKNRELIIKDLIAKANSENRVTELAEEIVKIIDLRVSEYRELLENYPKTAPVLTPLVQKAISSKKLVFSTLRGNF